MRVFGAVILFLPPETFFIFSHIDINPSFKTNSVPTLSVQKRVENNISAANHPVNTMLIPFRQKNPTQIHESPHQKQVRPSHFFSFPSCLQHRLHRKSEAEKNTFLIYKICKL